MRDSKPSDDNSRSARWIVILETPNRATSSCSDGRRVPSAHSPFSIPARMCCFTRSYGATGFVFDFIGYRVDVYGLYASIFGCLGIHKDIIQLPRHVQI